MLTGGGCTEDAPLPPAAGFGPGDAGTGAVEPVAPADAVAVAVGGAVSAKHCTVRVRKPPQVALQSEGGEMSNRYVTHPCVTAPKFRVAHSTQAMTSVVSATKSKRRFARFAVPSTAAALHWNAATTTSTGTDAPAHLPRRHVFMLGVPECRTASRDPASHYRRTGRQARQSRWTPLDTARCGWTHRHRTPHCTRSTSPTRPI